MAYKFNPFTGTLDEASSTQAAALLDEVDVVTTPPATGKLLKYTTNSKWEPGNTTLDELTDTDLEAEHIAPFGDGRALIYVNGKWQVGPVVGGYQYNTGNDPLAANVVYGNSYDTTLLDETGYWDQITKVLTVTSVGASPPVVQTTTKKYGLGSLQCDGSASYIQYSSTTHSSALNLGTQDFCIEFWARDTKGSSARGLFYYSCNSSFYLTINASGYLSPGGITGLGSNQIWPGGWVHVALTREGNLFRLFQNGVLVGSSTYVRDYTSPACTIRVGYSNPAAPYYWTGQIDDFRMTIGAARYTTNFTPPTGAILGENVIGPYSIDNLDDVDITTAAPNSGDALIYDGTNFTPALVPQTDVTGITGASAITNIVQISQANYDAIVTPDPNTLYVIV